MSWGSASFPTWLLAMFSGVLLSSCSALGRRLLSLLLWFSSVPLPAAPAVLHGMPYRRLPFGGYATFLAPSACPAPMLVASVGQPPFPLCSPCFCAGWLADVRWVLHPVTGFCHKGCDFSLSGSVVVP